MPLDELLPLGLETVQYIAALFILACDEANDAHEKRIETDE